LFENKKGFLLHGEHLEEHIKEAGFVDVKARAVKIDFRELTAGPSFFEFTLMERPENWSGSTV